jgi:hypothetical protein
VLQLELLLLPKWMVMLRVVVHLVREYFLQFCTHSLYIHGLIKCVEERSYTNKAGIYFYFLDNEDILSPSFYTGLTSIYL